MAGELYHTIVWVSYFYLALAFIQFIISRCSGRFFSFVLRLLLEWIDEYRNAEFAWSIRPPVFFFSSARPSFIFICRFENTRSEPLHPHPVLYNAHTQFFIRSPASSPSELQPWMLPLSTVLLSVCYSSHLPFLLAAATWDPSEKKRQEIKG